MLQHILDVTENNREKELQSIKSIQVEENKKIILNIPFLFPLFLPACLSQTFSEDFPCEFTALLNTY